MCGDEVPGEKEGDACGTSQTKRALRDEVRHRPLPNDANNEQTGCHDTGIDVERMGEDALPEWPPLPQQAEAEPRDADRAMSVAQKPSAPVHTANLRPTVVPRKITPNGTPTGRQRMGKNN